jgi:hypothetical protein
MRKAILTLALLAMPQVVCGQVRLSEKATVSQVINGTTITLEYYRPVARGREALFGSVVRWGETWTPGANWATTLETSRDIQLNGQRVPRGKYSVWMITAQDSAWTVFLHKDARLFHTRRPRGTDDDVARFQATPVTAPQLEALMWYFPNIQRDSAVLRMHWGTTAIDMRVHTEFEEDAALF